MDIDEIQNLIHLSRESRMSCSMSDYQVVEDKDHGRHIHIVDICCHPAQVVAAVSVDETDPNGVKQAIMDADFIVSACCYSDHLAEEVLRLLGEVKAAELKAAEYEKRISNLHKNLRRIGKRRG